MLFLQLLFAVAANAAFSLPKTDLALLGPVYEAQLDPSANAFAKAATQASEAVQEALTTANTSYGLLDTKGTSFSASVFIVGSDKPLFEYHFEAPELNGSYTKGNLTEDTVYRTGSLAKLFTMYVWMVDIGDTVFNDPITKYVPELLVAAQISSKEQFSTNWSEVTIGALASQISGIGNNFHTGDLAITGFGIPPTADDTLLGYPPLNGETVPQCNFYGPQKTCTRQQFLQGVIEHPPVYPSYTTPVYSNIAFAILALAYEEITKVPFDVGFSRVYNHKLGLSSTTPRQPPQDANAIIPRNESFSLFSYDLGLEAPAGGQYTSTKDMRIIGQSILSSKLLPSYITRRWMKPSTFTSQWDMAVGAPWEIYRKEIVANTIIDAGRIVDTYSKSGDVGAYSTYIGLVPDYNIGMTILAAGDAPGNSVYAIRDLLVDIYYPAAEAAAKEKAEKAFLGTFAAKDRNSSITLTVDGGPGIAITSWVSNGTDFLAGILAPYSDFRLFPTELSASTGDDGLTYYLYHLNSLQQNGEPFMQDFWSVFNNQWIMLDTLDYNNLATDAFVIGFDKQDVVQSVRCQALRSDMYRSGYSS
ncbi:putative membrane protein C663,14c [Talaromyces islandicus]|uniref:Putative membrane protein C663,14c n=1 Tax=Talaromyces islandicus TaxID=28573 RepID=A0A0U1LUE7_TALIS|nr:putative membrane protein C663,14c [Talaromyces islandicus]